MVGYGPTKKTAVEDFYRKLETAERQHPGIDTVSVSQIFAEFMQHKRSIKGRKGKTIFDDMGLYRRHLAPVIGDKPIGEVKLSELQAIQLSLLEAKKYRTAELATILLKSLYKYAGKRYRQEIRDGELSLPDVVEDLEAIRCPAGVTRKAGELWSLEQVGAFLDLAEARYNATIRSLLYPLFYKAIKAITAGLRRGELLGLRREALQYTTRAGKTIPCLDITEQYVYYGGVMHHDTPKSEDEVRRLPITPALETALQAHFVKLDTIRKSNPRWQEHGLMFPFYDGTIAGPRNIYRTRDELIETLGLPHSTLHQMRKVFCSYMTRQLIEQGRYSPKLMQRLLGHSRPDVALSVYTLVVEDDYLAAAFDARLDNGLDNSLDLESDERDGEL